MPALRSNPYAAVDWDAADRHRAQFHTHTSHPPTDGHSGVDPPDEVIDAYREAAYAVLALNEHEYNVEETTWPWTQWDRDPDDVGMVGVEAAELGGGGQRVRHDILSLFCNLADSEGMSVHEALAGIGDRGGLAVFAHPGRYHAPDEWEWYVEYFESHPYLLGLEVVNADDRYPGDRPLWDRLQAHLAPDRPVWGFANDDYHGRDGRYTFDRSRNVLLLKSATVEAVRTALREGRFFYQHAVPGGRPPAVDAICHDADSGELAVDAPAAETVEWRSGDEVVHDGRVLPYREVPLAGYARVRLVTAGGSETGTQPFLFG